MEPNLYTIMGRY
jgi:hypothetical protein